MAKEVEFNAVAKDIRLYVYTDQYLRITASRINNDYYNVIYN